MNDHSTPKLAGATEEVGLLTQDLRTGKWVLLYYLVYTGSCIFTPGMVTFRTWYDCWAGTPAYPLYKLGIAVYPPYPSPAHTKAPHPAFLEKTPG